MILQSGECLMLDADGTPYGEPTSVSADPFHFFTWAEGSSPNGINQITAFMQQPQP